MHDSSAKDEAKKEGLMELIKKMYAMMDEEEKEAMDSPEEGKEPSEEAPAEALSMFDDKKGPGLMEKAMEKSGEEDSDLGKDLDMEEIKEFLTKKRKAPVGKSINFMAITKAPVKKFDAPKLMPKYLKKFV